MSVYLGSFIVILLSFYFYGKFVMLCLVYILSILLMFNHRHFYDGIKYPILLFASILSVFILASMTGLLFENDPKYIMYDVYGVIYIFMGLCVVFLQKDQDELKFFLLKTIRALTYLAIMAIALYLVAMLNTSYGSTIYKYLCKTNFAFSFAGFGKLISRTTCLYLLFFPYVIVSGNVKTIMVWFAVIFLSVSIAQYLSLLVMLMLYLMFKIKIQKFLVYKKSTIRRITLTITIMAVFAVLGYKSNLVIEFKNKFEAVTDVSKDASESGVSSRIIQAKILLREFAKSPWIGQGLGYQSAEYNSIRSQWGRFPERNLAMYENQYLDVLMKFGIFGTLVIFICYFTMPFLVVLTHSRLRRNPLSTQLLIGLAGFFIYAGSNGNTFYCPPAMFGWGVSVAIIFWLMSERSPKPFPASGMERSNS